MFAFIQKTIFYIFFVALMLWILDIYLLADKITIAGGLGGYAVIALIFGVINTFIKPIVKFITLPINTLTLGLFTLVINAGIPYLIQQLLFILDLGITLELADWTLYPIVGFFMTLFVLLIP